MMELDEMAGWIRRVNESNGFDAPTWEKLPTKLMLTVTELNEARDAVRGTGEDPLPEELADTAVRLLDILGVLWPGQIAQVRVSEVELKQRALFRSIEALLWLPLNYLCVAVEAWRYDNRDDAGTAVGMALRETWMLGEALRYDMAYEIRRKVSRNMKRGRLHGKKRADG